MASGDPGSRASARASSGSTKMERTTGIGGTGGRRSHPETPNTVLREGAGLAIVATGLGLWGVLATGRLAGSLLFGVTPADPGVLAGAAGLLVMVSLVAVLAPARRASRISPLRAIEPD